MQLGETICQSPEDFKAWSQNLGHEGVLTTFYSYGTVSGRRQGEIIKTLAKPKVSKPGSTEELAEALVRAMRREGVSLG
ncbi:MULTISPECIES: hypothetical protein [unclassified Roseateles]|uniref:hypothetical protein n=1 Tax=unclassified Roseateles TaxID=2626991 RepID=UPI0006F3DB47|nr:MULTISPECIES: hypothetical protein [unclassified Roseateles]KQW46708.1 hypothetical protein ASC81_10075 [Pelomonas sp. Root405]KRA73760.1 hypothetical protein ASD88_10075 [Pelomonas sp. Root662]